MKSHRWACWWRERERERDREHQHQIPLFHQSSSKPFLDRVPTLKPVLCVLTAGAEGGIIVKLSNCHYWENRASVVLSLPNPKKKKKKYQSFSMDSNFSKILVERWCSLPLLLLCSALALSGVETYTDVYNDVMMWLCDGSVACRKAQCLRVEPTLKWH